MWAQVDSNSNNHSGELLGSNEHSPIATESQRATGNAWNLNSSLARSDSEITLPFIHSSRSSVNSPPLSVLPTGNIYPLLVMVNGFIIFIFIFIYATLVHIGTLVVSFVYLKSKYYVSTVVFL